MEYITVEDRIEALTIRVNNLEEYNSKFIEIAKHQQSTINNLIKSIGSLQKLVELHSKTEAKRMLTNVTNY